MNSNFVIVGLPASGKTTFLAALWHVIEAEEIECRLKVDKLDGDLKYLNEIAEAWRTFRKVPRTSQVGDKDISISFVDGHTGNTGQAFFPDLAGETFDTQIEARRCRAKFVQNVAVDDGLLLFISVDTKQDTLSIVELNSMMPAEEPLQSASNENAARREWQPKYIPAQVRIVQILSDLLRGPFRPRQRRLAVILSAWDIVSPSGFTPEEWLTHNMPLVQQFLATNVDAFDFSIYGISAQGLSLDDDRAVNDATRAAASKRITVVGAGGRDSDITRPVVWLMSPTLEQPKQ